MKEKCLSRNPLVRDGTSQPGRLLKTLLPGYVSVDERSMKDLVEFAQLFSTEVQFFDSNNTVDNTWSDFFQLTNEDWATFSLENYLEKLKTLQETKPHWALFFSFLYLFKIAQEDLNGITKRHLDFYYRDVLQLEEKPAVTDQVSVVFKLAKHVSQHLVKKGTLLKAGKDQTGVDLFYKVEKDVVVNKATVADVKALFVNVNNIFSDASKDHRLYASPIANTADGLGADFETEQKDWRTFGEPSFLDGNADRLEGTIGFAIASPILFLAEGDRTITFTIDLTTDVSALNLTNLFSVQFSGEEEWIEEWIDETNTTPQVSTDKKQLFISARLKPDQPAVVAYNKSVLLEPIETEFPIAKLVLKNTDTSVAYAKLVGLMVEKITVNVEVRGVRQLILQNDQALLDSSKPFQPFTHRPTVGSNFYIGSWEIFQKNLTKVEMDIVWDKLPEDPKGFYDYYLNYLSKAERTKIEESGLEMEASSFTDPGDEKTKASPYLRYRINTDFTISTALLYGKSWNAIKANAPLFTKFNGNPIPAKGSLLQTENLSQIAYNGTTFDNFDRKSNLEKETKFTNQSQYGFLKWTLDGKDFGHNYYPKAYAAEVIIQAKTGSGDASTLPNEPYTPSIQSLAINYSSEQIINLGGKEETIDKIFHIEPFGVKKIKTTASNNTLVPHFTEEAHLYIGLENFQPPQTLSLLFQVAEGSANPDKAKQKVDWHYLQDNQWVLFEENQKLSEATNGLLNSGIIQFEIPKKCNNKNTLLPSAYHWIKASVANDSDAICRLVDIQAQAVVAKFFDQNNDPNHLGKALPADTIAKLNRSDSAIDKVIQPYASYGGKLKEQDSAFYTRVSERLRHKQRAITMWDYERLILQKYPEVYKVKCINHTRFEGTLSNYSEIAPGHVTVIVVSNVQNKNAVDPLRPKTSLTLLSEIEQFIRKISPPCIQLHFKNPLYEEIKVDFKVKFLPGMDVGFFLQKLNTEIRFFLSPWASDCPQDIVFGGKIHKSMILNFVEERSYVDYVTCFKMYHSVPTDSNNTGAKNLDEVAATTAVSILGSADQHTIKEITIGDCDCDDNEVVPAKLLASADDCSC